MFGGLRTKIDFDLFERRPYAFGILKAADIAKQIGVRSITAVEFGVASGVGLMSMSRIASAVSAETGIEIDVLGFDSAIGMPAAIDYRDHPEYYFQGDFAPPDFRALQDRLPKNCRLVIGDVRQTVPDFVKNFSGTLGFVSVDVDYYSSAVGCLQMLTGPSDRYLPAVPMFFDDVLLDFHNAWSGERLAISEFNDAHTLRKIAPFTALRNKRIIKSASWIEQMYCLHVLDHAARSPANNAPAVPRSM
jgi:hypothetical protein